MKGCIYKRGKLYTIIIETGRDINGKRMQKWFSGYKTKKEAEKDMVKLLNQLETNMFINPEKITLAEYLKQWLSDYVETNLAQKTFEGYRVNIESHIIPSIGNILLQKLQPINIQKFYKEKLENGRVDGKGGLSAKSVLYIHRVLRKALDQAVKMQLIPRNVADAVTPPKVKQFKASFLDENQVKEMLEAFQPTKIHIPVLLAAGVGLRRGEALGLQWKDIDFQNKTVSISRSLLPSKKGLIFHEPKTENSNRVLILPQTILDELQNHKELQDNIKNIAGNAYHDNDLVTCYEDGSPINPASFSHTFARTLKRKNLGHIRFHDLRHANATLMLKYNIPSKVASERLGHSSIGITLDLYSHVLKEMQEDAAKKFDEGLFKNNNRDMDKKDD